MKKTTPTDLKQKGFWQYEKMVWGNGFKRFRADIGILPTAISIVASVGAAFVIQTTRSQAGDVVTDAMIAALFLLLLCGAMLLWDVSRESVSVYNEKQHDLWTYWNKYDAPDPMCPLTITPYEDQTTFTVIGIRMENPETIQRVSHLRVMLDELWNISPTGERTQIKVDDANRGFPNGISFEPGGSINPTQYAILFIAKAESAAITFDLARPLQQDYTDERRDVIGLGQRFARFEIIISISGFIEDRPFMKTRYGIHADFEGGDPVFAKATITALQSSSNHRK